MRGRSAVRHILRGAAELSLDRPLLLGSGVALEKTAVRKRASAGTRGFTMQYDCVISAPGLACRPRAKATADETLLARIAAQDAEAMRMLFVRYNVRVFRFLQRILGDAAAAEDLVNEVFLEIWRHAGRFETRSKASTWILAIARYKAASALRRRSFDQLDDDAVESVEDPAADPEFAAQENQRGAILRDCLAQLPAAHRQILDLIYYREQSISEAARIVGAPQNTVKTRAYHARKRVAQLMAARGVERAWL
jgi:RNA polymerase sigma-70 factor, ECF subfamily